MHSDTHPDITAVVCTRNRPESVVVAVQSILASSRATTPVIVVDQSASDDSERALRALPGAERLRYVHSKSVGLARARNIGVAHATTPVIAFTDDDCEVAPGWLDVIANVFSLHPHVAILFCSVLAGPHDPLAGFIPAYHCRGTRILRSIRDKPTARGIGAGIAVRTAPLQLLGGFDELLGAGAEFPSCEDGDVAVRALLAGFEVCETDATHVVHHGFRSWHEGRELARRDWTGIGAAYCKPLRAGRLEFMPVPLYELLVQALWPPVKDLVHLRRPHGLFRALHFYRGFRQGLATPLDREKLVFRASSSTGW